MTSCPSTVLRQSFHDFKFDNMYLFLCLHFASISVFWLRYFVLSHCIINSFSDRHRRHFPATVVYDEAGCFILNAME